jgi:hypothetical protein
VRVLVNQRPRKVGLVRPITHLDKRLDVDEADPREQAAKYGLEDGIDSLLRYPETHGEVDDDRLPEWDEFQKLAADHEVRLS